MRLCGTHPTFEIAYVGGDSTAGQSLAQRFPALVGHPAGRLQIQPFVPENISGLDLLFASLPTGRSREPLGRVGKNIRIVDIGGDHRFAAVVFSRHRVHLGGSRALQLPFPEEFQ